MTNDPIYNHLRELSWRRKLTAAEEAELRAWLAAHPEAQVDWEVEAGLNAALGALQDVPVVSCLLIQDAQRHKLVESVAAVSAVASLPSPDVLKDFDAIRASNPTPRPDEQLLTVLQ